MRYIKVSKGFTLLELIIVILLVALMVGMVSPLIIRSIQRSEVNQVGKNLLAALRKVRAHALITNNEQVITFSFDNNSYSIPSNNKKTIVPADYKVKLLTAESELNTEDNTGNIRFFPDGSSTGGQISLESENKKIIINIDWLTGSVNIERKLHE